VSTASIAADVIRQHASSTASETPSTPEGSNAHEFPDIAGQEFDALMADDPTNRTRAHVAAHMVTSDRRPYVSTRGGLVRRQFDNDGDPTRRAAREAIDLQAWADGQKADPRDRRAMQAHGFAREINGSTMANSLPSGGEVFAPGSDEWRQSGDAVIDALAQRVLENQK
jgi:hypothetical protein